MNILLTTPSGNGKIIQGGSIQDGVSLANSLGLTEYNVLTYNAAIIVVNDVNGNGYNVNLNDQGTNQRFLIFDSSSSNVTSWITNNYPTATITTFGKTSIILASA